MFPVFLCVSLHIQFCCVSCVHVFSYSVPSLSLVFPVFVMCLLIVLLCYLCSAVSPGPSVVFPFVCALCCRKQGEGETQAIP